MEVKLEGKYMAVVVVEVFLLLGPVFYLTWHSNLFYYIAFPAVIWIPLLMRTKQLLFLIRFSALILFLRKLTNSP